MMSEPPPPRVDRKAPRFFGLPDERPQEADDTDAPAPVGRPPTERTDPVPPNDVDPQAADTAAVLMDPGARHEVGRLVDARRVKAEIRQLLVQHRLLDAPAAADDTPPAPDATAG